MFNASIPFAYWDQIFQSIIFIINRLPSLSGNKLSLFETLFHQQPDYQFLKVLGCECFPLLRPYTGNKLQPRSASFVFIGYSSTHKGYYCLHIPINKTYISRHVIFNETVFPFAQLPSTPSSNSQSIQYSNTIIILPFTKSLPHVTDTQSYTSLQSPHIPTLPFSSPPPQISHSMVTKTENKYQATQTVSQLSYLCHNSYLIS
jgi:hypothetical protein